MLSSTGAKTMDTNDLQQLTANAIRSLAMDAVQQANSGHPGMPMGMADAATVLWSQHLKFDPQAPDWPNRDRFVLSAGHGSMLLYALLHLSGYDLSLADLKRFRQWDICTPGHPEVGHIPGVETTTGPLGQQVRKSSGGTGLTAVISTFNCLLLVDVQKSSRTTVCASRFTSPASVM